MDEIKNQVTAAPQGGGCKTLPERELDFQDPPGIPGQLLMSHKI